MSIEDIIDVGAERGKASIGHNSSNAQSVTDLTDFVEQVERLSEEKKGIADDIRDVFSEIKARGYDVKTVRYVIAERKKEQAVRDEERVLRENYLSALGLL